MKVRQARYLRRNATAAEKRLWSRLKNRQTGGLKFRRQHPIATRIVDFFCAEAKLAIELDGSGHARHPAKASDLDRELEIHEKGIRVLRFRNREIFKNLSGVLNAIIYAADPEKIFVAIAATRWRTKVTRARLALTGASRPRAPDPDS